MAAKWLRSVEEARGSSRSRVNTLVNAVKATLGPKSRNVGLDKECGAPTITKDGVTVRATGLAESIVQAMMKNVPAGAKPMAVKRGIDKAVEAVWWANAHRAPSRPREERDRPRSNDLGERGATLNQPCKEG